MAEVEVDWLWLRRLNEMDQYQLPVRRWTMRRLWVVLMAAALASCASDTPTYPGDIPLAATGPGGGSGGGGSGGGDGGGGGGGTVPPTTPPKEKACRVTLTLVDLVAVTDNESGQELYRITTRSNVPPPRFGRPLSVDVLVDDDEIGKPLEINELLGAKTYRKSEFPKEASLEVEVREIDDPIRSGPPGLGIENNADDVGRARDGVKLACPQDPPKELSLEVVDLETEKQERSMQPVPIGNPFIQPFRVILRYRWEVVLVEVD